MKFRKSNHGVYRTQYHVVWVTKYRLKLLNPGLQDHLRKLLREIIKSMPGVEIQEVNVQSDHIHMMTIIPPKYAVSNVVATMKAKSAGIFLKKYRLFNKAYKNKKIVWSSGYFVSTIGIDEHIIENYIKYQGTLDSGQAELDL